jgi:3-oxoacyl-[acyl-carrier protein] reductase
MADRLAGKRAIITGGASGFGAGIARKFVREGARVVIADVDAVAGERLARSLDCQFALADVRSYDTFARLADAFADTDVVVSNAGVGHTPQPAELVDEETFERVVDVNVRPFYHAVRAFVPVMKARGGGVFINIASTAGVSPRPGLSWYNASKGWLITATRSLAVELAANGIRVNAVNPVAGDTPMLATFMGGDTPELRAKFLSTIPLGRFSTPQDVANAACYLASDEAGMVTGVALEVDGGRVI